jgi:AhpD family alkylhydroperoxidase
LQWRGGQGPQAIPAAIAAVEKLPLKQETSKMGCCEGSPEADHLAGGDAGNAAATERKFQAFLEAAGTPGALDGKTKRAIAIALSVMARCEPCLKSHLKKARDLGLSQAEIDEAAWMAIGFGGSPTMVFYNAIKNAQ